MTCKCRICGKKLNTETAYKVVIKNKNRYYCSQEEYDMYIENQKRTAELKQNIKDILCYIFNMPAIVNTLIYKEWQEWNQIATDQIIFDYLEENKIFLQDKVSQTSPTEYAKIKYLSAILKNSLNDYQKDEPRPERKIKDVTIEEYVAKYLDPNLSFNPEVTLAERVRIIIDPLFLEDDLIAETVNSLTYEEFLTTPYWNTITDYKKEQANFKCKQCGSNKHTCTHHKTYAHHGYEHTLEVINQDLVVLCDACHKKIHNINDDEI